MPRSEEAEFWTNAVYEAVQEIPLGKVTSYGHVAVLLGQRMLFPPPLSYSIIHSGMYASLATYLPRYRYRYRSS